MDINIKHKPVSISINYSASILWLADCPSEIVNSNIIVFLPLLSTLAKWTKIIWSDEEEVCNQYSQYSSVSLNLKIISDEISYHDGIISEFISILYG